MIRHAQCEFSSPETCLPNLPSSVFLAHFFVSFQNKSFIEITFFHIQLRSTHHIPCKGTTTKANKQGYQKLMDLLHTAINYVKLFRILYVLVDPLIQHSNY
jgi:hypothetical protein